MPDAGRDAGCGLRDQGSRLRQGYGVAGGGSDSNFGIRDSNFRRFPPEWGHGSSFYGDVVLEHTLTEEEHSQIVQTIEMFEVITQTQPDDYQSLEILKEAYQKVGRASDSLKTSRRLAEAYFNVGSYTLAMQECEVILLKEPNAPEILAMLGDIETRLQASGHQIATGGSKNGLTAPVSTNGVNGLTHLRSQEGALTDLQQGRQAQNLRDRGDD